VHLGGDRGGKGCGDEENAEGENSHKSANEIRRYPAGKVLRGFG
jgi:hypothetical protein